jgi:putative NADH-flavin reductase
VIATNARVFSGGEVAGPYANVAAEHRRDVAILRESALDWTVVAAPMLTDDPATGSYVAVVDGKGPGRSITRGDFATALLDALEKDAWIRHIVGVTNPPADAEDEK